MQIRDRIKDFRRVKASELIPNPRNARKHPGKQQKCVRAGIEKIGIWDVLLTVETPEGLMLLDGHLRAELDLHGDVEWPVAVLDVTEDEANEILLVHDPLSEMAEYDSRLLDDLMATVKTDDDDLRAMLEELKQSAIVVEPDEPDTVEDVEPQSDRGMELMEQWGTAEGQLWIVEGRETHRLLCGDSTKAEDVARVMGGENADLVFTSPPYGQQREYDKNSKVDVSDWDALMNGVFYNLPAHEKTQVLVNLGLIHRHGEWIPYWDAWIQFMRDNGWRRFGWYVWDQGFGLPGDWNGRFGPSHEFLFHFNKQSVTPAKWCDKQPENIKPRHAMESTMRRADGKTVAFTNPGASAQATKVPDSVIRIGRQVGSNGHPAQFPEGLARAVMHSWPGAVYDPFLGSGTTMLAAEQLGRKCYGIEISPQYCAVILQRMTDAGCECRLAEDTVPV